MSEVAIRDEDNRDISKWAVVYKQPEEFEEELREILPVGMELRPSDLAWYRVPGKDGSRWIVRGGGADPDDEGPKEVTAIILDRTTPRGFWSSEYGGEGDEAKPDCWSDDGVTGTGNPGGECRTCVFNEWGTAEQFGRGKGKACKEMFQLLLLERDNIFPSFMIIPSTSLKEVHRYFVSTAGKGGPTAAIVRFGLRKKQTTNGMIVNVVTPKSIEKIPAAHVRRLKEYAQAMIALIPKRSAIITNDSAEVIA